MRPNLKAYSSDGTTLLEEITLDAAVGSEGDATAFRFVNDDVDGAVDDALQPSITVRQENLETGDAVQRGLRAVDERWIQIRTVGTGSPGDDHVESPWQPVGRGLDLVTPLLPSGGWHDSEIRYCPPLSAPEGEINFQLSAEDNQTVVAIEYGHTEASRDGILSGIGDGTHSELVRFGGMTATGTPDDQVHLGDIEDLHAGVPHVILAHAETLDGNDGASVALGTAKGYWCRFSVGAAGTVTQTKTPQFDTSSADPSDVPNPPAGERSLGWALRTDDAAIGPSDITVDAVEGRWAFSNPSGRILAVGPGRARQDNRLVRRESKLTITLPASTEANKVWMVGNSLATGDARPSPRAYLLCAVDTDGSSVLMGTLVDYRDPIGAEHQAHVFQFPGTPSEGDKAFGVHRSNRTGYLRLDRAFVLNANDFGGGNSAGELRIEFKVNGTTVFTSSGADDRRPQIRFDNANPDTAALPEVLEIPPFAMFEASLTYVTPFDGTGPSNLVLSVTIEVP